MNRTKYEHNLLKHVVLKSPPSSLCGTYKYILYIVVQCGILIV